MNNQSNLLTLYRKELADHLNSKRFFIILGLVAILGLSSIYSSAYGLRDAVSDENNTFVFLKLFTTSGGSIPSFLSFLSFLGPLVGLALGFDSINSEMANGTLSRVLAQPIHRDSIINGKFLAGVSVISIMIFSVGFLISGLGILLIGIPPTAEEILRLLVFLLFTIVYISIWLAISQLFSLILKQMATSALASIAVWLVLSLFMGLIAGIVADAVFPLNNNSTWETALHHAQLQNGVSRLSPSTLYGEAMITVLSPGIRTLSPVMSQQLTDAIPGVLSFGQSLLLIWPHLVSLLAVVLICFAIGYIIFMKQEIRAS